MSWNLIHVDMRSSSRDDYKTDSVGLRNTLYELSNSFADKFTQLIRLNLQKWLVKLSCLS